MFTATTITADRSLTSWEMLERYFDKRKGYECTALDAYTRAKDETKQWERIRAALAPITPTDDADARAKLDAQYDNPHPDSADLALLRTLAPFRRLPRNDFKVGAGVYPFPVYVASYADGRTARYSFWTRKGKPIDFAAGFNAAMILGRAVPVAGHVEYQGQQHADPHFEAPCAPAPVRARRASVADYRRQLAEIADALARGDVDIAKQICAR